MPKPGTLFSASWGATLVESAAGVPHGNIRWTMAGQICANDGRLSHEPEVNQTYGIINQQHVHVVEGGEVSAFGAVELSPVPKESGSVARIIASPCCESGVTL